MDNSITTFVRWKNFIFKRIIVGMMVWHQQKFGDSAACEQPRWRKIKFNAIILYSIHDLNLFDILVLIKCGESSLLLKGGINWWCNI